MEILKEVRVYRDPKNKESRICECAKCKTVFKYEPFEVFKEDAEKFVYCPICGKRHYIEDSHDSLSTLGILGQI